MTNETIRIIKNGIEFTKNESKGWYQFGITYYNGRTYWGDICDSIMEDDEARTEHYIIFSLIFYQLKIGRFFQYKEVQND